MVSELRAHYPTHFVFQVFSGSDSSEPDRSKDDFSWVNGAIDTKPSDVEIETLNDENTFKVMIVFVKIAAVYVGLSLRQFVSVFFNSLSRSSQRHPE